MDDPSRDALARIHTGRKPALRRCIYLFGGSHGEPVCAARKERKTTT
ncbi:MAG TPA: hypothetical protein VES20_20385 [Bryobacteraceae bacterium]|nr:hypothetical protein [Bryobacteraceae bacterium]